MMLAAATEAQNYLKEKYNGVENVKPGVYAVPTNTSKGPAFMRVEILPDMGMKGFELFLDEELTKSWYDA